ncbi:MAG: T9SS type A sorting domain-containing protein [Bacteroidota bacterium]
MIDTTFQLSFDMGGEESGESLAANGTGVLLIGHASEIDSTFTEGLWTRSMNAAGQLSEIQLFGTQGKYWTRPNNGDLIQTSSNSFVYAGTEWEPGISNTPLVLWFDSVGQLFRKELYLDSMYHVKLQNGIHAPDSSLILYGSATRKGGSIFDVDRYLLKLDPMGNKVWSRTYGGDGDDHSLGTSLVCLHSGYVMCGSTTSFSGNETRDGWLLYTDVDGEIVNELIVGTEGNDGAISIALAPDSTSLYVVQQIDTLLAPGYAEQALRVMQIDSNGLPIWQQIIQDSLSRLPEGIQVLSDGNLLLYGSLGILPNYAAGYGWLAKFSSQGALLWERAIQHPDQGFTDPLFQINSIADVLEVSPQQLMLFGQTALRDGVGRNPWLLLVDEEGCLSDCDSLPDPFQGPYTSVQSVEISEIKVFPNPTKDHIIVAFPSSSLPATCQWWDLSGRLVKTVLLNQSETRISVADLPRGLYGVWLFNEAGERYRRKVMVE